MSMPETFSTLVDLVTLAELGDTLATTQDITVMAPVNDAFAALPSEVVANLQTEPWKLHLQDTLSYHVIPSVVPASAVTDGLEAEMLNGETATFTTPDGGVVVNGNANVVSADVAADNGLIHVIDNVLLPSWVSNSIVDRAVATPTLSTLVNLVTQAGLVETLSTGGPFTVFAPTDEAFSQAIVALTGREVGEVELDNELVSTLLTYHVVEGIYPASAIEDGLELTTVQGEPIVFAVSDDGPTVNSEGIIATDVLANNGIVHLIDGVLVPNAAGVGAEPAPEMGSPAPAPMEDTMAPTTAAAGSVKVFAGLVAAAAVAVLGM